MKKIRIWKKNFFCLFENFYSIGIFIICAFSAFLSANERYSLHHGAHSFRSILRNYWSVLSFRSFAWLQGCFFCLTVAFNVVLQNYALFFSHVYQKYRIFPFVIMLIYGTAFVVMPIWHKLLPKFGKKTLLTCSILPFLCVLFAHLYVDYCTNFKISSFTLPIPLFK